MNTSLFEKLVGPCYQQEDPLNTYGLLEYCIGMDAETVNITTLVRSAIDPQAVDVQLVPFSLGGTI